VRGHVRFCFRRCTTLACHVARCIAHACWAPVMPLGVGVARYGTLAGNAMDSLLRRMNALYMPTFLGNKQWPESFKKEFSGTMLCH
jgi:hypothetical protein